MMLKRNYTRLFFLMAIVLIGGKSMAQNISFSKLMTYFITQDEKMILNDLKAANFIIEKEKPADAVGLFDTQRNCYKSLPGKPTTLTGFIIYKIRGQFYALSYFTLDKSDFNKKIQEINSRGFKLATEDSISAWFYQKGDTLISVEKRTIEFGGKEYIRHEIGVVISNNKTGLLSIPPPSRRRFLGNFLTSFGR